MLGLWVDTGFAGIDALETALFRFGKADAKKLSQQDSVYHHFATAMRFFLTDAIDDVGPQCNRFRIVGRHRKRPGLLAG